MSPNQPTARAEDIPIRKLRAARDVIVAAMSGFDYVNAAVFLTIANAAVVMLMLGLDIPANQRNRRRILDRISTDSQGKSSGACLTWNSWKERLDRRSEEKRHRPPARDRTWLPAFLQQDQVSIDEDFGIYIGSGADKLILVGPRGKIVKRFSHPDDLANLGLRLIEGSTTIAIETALVPATDLDESVAEEAITRLNHLMRHGIADEDCSCSAEDQDN